MRCVVDMVFDRIDIVNLLMLQLVQVTNLFLAGTTILTSPHQAAWNTTTGVPRCHKTIMCQGPPYYSPNSTTTTSHRRQGVAVIRRPCFWRRLRAGRLRPDVAPAERARPVRVEPHVDAADVEQVPARRQLPHHLAGLHVLQAHGAQRAPPGLAAPAAAAALRVGHVGERRQDIDCRRRARHAAAGPPRRRPHGRKPCRGAVVPAPPVEAAHEAERRGDSAGEGARLGDADRGGEDGEQEQRRAGDDDAVAGEVAVVGGGAWRRRPSLELVGHPSCVNARL
jgi:hypothetical protein